MLVAVDCVNLQADYLILRFRRSNRANSARRSACSNNAERLPASATIIERTKNPIAIVRQSDTSPGEPG